jgi:outer membrane immunogenic protein
MQIKGDTHMHRLVIASLTAASLSVGLTATASAADLGRPAPAPVYTKAPIAVPFSWTGFYVGANAGWGWARGGSAESCINSTTGNSSGCAVFPDSALSADGFFGGGQAGYNWQVSNWVLGIEADFQGADIKGSSSISGVFNSPATFTASEKIDWFGTVRPRAGLAMGNTLLYVTGGLMYAEIKTSQDLAFTTVSFPATSSTTKAGWTAGGGIEWAVNRNWSVKAEGLYYDLGNVTTAATQVPPSSPFTDFKTFDFHGALARVGVNYLFH